MKLLLVSLCAFLLGKSYKTDTARPSVTKVRLHFRAAPTQLTHVDCVCVCVIHCRRHIIPVPSLCVGHTNKNQSNAHSICMLGRVYAHTCYTYPQLNASFLEATSSTYSAHTYTVRTGLLMPSHLCCPALTVAIALQSRRGSRFSAHKGRANTHAF